MLTIIIGQTGAGKTSLARRLAEQSGAVHVSAGSWIRDITGRHDHGPEAAAYLAVESRRRLAEDPGLSSRILFAKVELVRGSDVIVEGVRNPLDLLTLLRPGDAVVDVGGSGVNPWESSGLAACRSLRAWVEGVGCSWSEYHRHLVSLPQPLRVYVAREWLHGNPSGPWEGWEPGYIQALECYPGERVTVAFRSGGGIFHDLPLRAIRTSSEQEVLPYPDEQCYSASPAAREGSPVFELPPMQDEDADCWVHDRSRARLGRGTTLGVLHWPQGNLLLHLVRFGSRLLLWPPHKLLFGEGAAAELPNWSKLRPQAATPASKKRAVAEIMSEMDLD